MFDWLFEGQLPIYLLLGVAAAALVGLWWRDRRRHWLIALGVTALLSGGYYLLDRAVETRREQIDRRTREMAAAVEQGDADAILRHVSPAFDWQGLNKDGFGRFLRAALVLSKGKSVKVSNFSYLDDAGKVRFQATAFDAKGTPFPGHVIATFSRDDDGQWRLRGMEIYYGNSTTPVGRGDLSRWAGQ